MEEFINNMAYELNSTSWKDVMAESYEYAAICSFAPDETEDIANGLYSQIVERYQFNKII